MSCVHLEDLHARVWHSRVFFTCVYHGEVLSGKAGYTWSCYIVKGRDDITSVWRTLHASVVQANSRGRMETVHDFVANNHGWPSHYYTLIRGGQPQLLVSNYGRLLQKASMKCPAIFAQLDDLQPHEQNLLYMFIFHSTVMGERWNSTIDVWISHHWLH